MAHPFNKGGNSRKLGHYSFLYWDNYLRRLIIDLLKLNNIPRKKIAEVAGTYPSAVSNYLNRSGNKTNLTDWQIITICDFLGLELELNVKVKKQ